MLTRNGVKILELLTFPLDPESPFPCIFCLFTMGASSRLVATMAEDMTDVAELFPRLEIIEKLCWKSVHVRVHYSGRGSVLFDLVVLCKNFFDKIKKKVGIWNPRERKRGGSMLGDWERCHAVHLCSSFPSPFSFIPLSLFFQ